MVNLGAINEKEWRWFMTLFIMSYFLAAVCRALDSTSTSTAV